MKKAEGTIIKKQGMTIIRLVFLSIVAGCASMNGPLASEADKSYQTIIDIAGKDKNSLYVNANSWFVDTFNSAGSVIQYQDKEAGKIMGKFIFLYKDSLYWYSVKSTVSVEVKDNKARLSFYDPSFKVTGDSLNGTYHDDGEYRDMTEAVMKRTRENWLSLEASLKKTLSSTSTW
jgi:hypothetical protein